MELLDDPYRLRPSICMYVAVSKTGQRKEKGIYRWRIFFSLRLVAIGF